MPCIWLDGGVGVPYAPPLQPPPPRIRAVPETSETARADAEGSGAGGGGGDQAAGEAVEAYEKAGPSPPAKARKPALLVRQIMTSPAETLSLEASVEDAWDLIRKHRFRHIPVLSDAGALAGIVSDRDLLRAKGKGKVADVMTRKVLTATGDTKIREVARIMVDERVHAVPVIDAGQKVEGILTSTDVLRCVMNRALDLSRLSFPGSRRSRGGRGPARRSC
ncbi:MAG: CBS domain-containing protein [Planctomycetota bacterium]|jgi:acetoin utilization protein AcuB